MLPKPGVFLRSLEIRAWPERLGQQYPFSLPFLQPGGRIDFASPVTFLVGENGSGKSTLLEAIACASGSITVGAESVSQDASLKEVRELAKYVQLAWFKRTRKGFFLRAEDFFGFARKMAHTRADLESDLANIEKEYEGRSELAKNLARTPYLNELGGIRRRYGQGLDSQSHGESFLLLFQSRFVPGGLYLLDEPEAPLSPIRQLGFLALLKEMVSKEAQFIIATHSPILMAFPGAEIFSFDQGAIQQVEYENLEHVRLTRDFLNQPDAFLRHL